MIMQLSKLFTALLGYKPSEEHLKTYREEVEKYTCDYHREYKTQPELGDVEEYDKGMLSLLLRLNSSHQHDSAIEFQQCFTNKEEFPKVEFAWGCLQGNKPTFKCLQGTATFFSATDSWVACDLNHFAYHDDDYVPQEPNKSAIVKHIVDNYEQACESALELCDEYYPTPSFQKS